MLQWGSEIRQAVPVWHMCVQLHSGVPRFSQTMLQQFSLLHVCSHLHGFGALISTAAGQALLIGPLAALLEAFQHKASM
jgi:hypothetical protein